MLLFAFIVLTIPSVHAIEIKFDSSNESESFEEYKKTLCSNSLKYGDITFRGNLIFDGNDLFSYCEFQNPNLVLENFKNMYEKELNILSTKYSLGILNKENWETFYKAAILNNNLNIINFFDIYENTYKNNEIEKIITNYNKEIKNNKKSTTIDSTNLIDEVYDELFYLLPTYNYFESKENGIIPYATQTFNITNGVTYAENNYNNTNNSTYGYIEGADCTNFVSQILVAGGYNTVWGLTNKFGWWYKKENSNSFKYSWSWNNANSFIKYWGVKTSTTDFHSFSVSVKKGDFISLDFTNDGDYNHSGFVTGTTTNTISTVIDDTSHGASVPVTYRNFKIAQHTNEYNLYVNNVGNHWEENVINGARYGIVNINKN